MIAKVAFAMCLVLIAFNLANGQSATATLSGVVADAKGDVVPGATIVLRNSATGAERTGTSNESGQFTFALLAAGEYSLRASRGGFDATGIPRIVLNVNDSRVIKVNLATGGVVASVEVSAEEAALINESTAVATTVDRKFIATLPLNGRSLQSLIALTPGVNLGSFGTTSSNALQFSVNGQRPTANYFSLDGVSANVGTSTESAIDQQTNGGSPALTVGGGTQSLISLDALQEFTIQTSTTGAKFGRQPGGQISMQSRSGTNLFSGALFEYFRNEALDANDWFANRQSFSKAPLRQNDFGGVFGGPIFKNKTHFFGSYEGLRLRLPQTKVFTVSSAAFRAAAHPLVRPILDASPLPNGTVTGNTGQYIASWSDPQTTDAYSIKIDHSLTKSMSLFGRYHDSPSEATRRNLNPALLDSSTVRAQTLTVGSTWVMSAKMTNDFRFNFSRSRGTGFWQMDDFGGATPLDPAAFLPSFADPTTSQLSITVTGITGSNNIGPFGLNVNRQLNFVDDMTYVAGDHRLEFGVDYRHLFPRSTPQPYLLGLTVLNATTALTRYTVTASEPAELVFPAFSSYAQDTWKVTPKFTLTYGLRWELVPPPSSSNGVEPYTFSDYSSLPVLTYAPVGTKQWETTYNNFAPRFGVAYNVNDTPGKELVIRGGFGLYYDLGLGNFGSVIAQAPFRRQVIVAPSTGIVMPANPSLLTPPAFNLSTPISLLRAFDRNIKLPYTWQWNVSVQKSFGASQSLTASYVGAAGRRLLQADSRVVNVYATTSVLTLTKNGSYSDYNALQLQFMRRLSRGFQALVNYTFAKSTDNSSGDSLIGAYATNVPPEYFVGPSNFDIRHNFSTALTFDLPSPWKDGALKHIFGGWSTDTIFKAVSAPPLNILVQQNTGFGTFGNRPNVVDGQPVWITDPLEPNGKRLNPAAFSASTGAAGTLVIGNATRNDVRGFGSWQLDTSVSRKFRLGFLNERTNLVFRAEMFNILNHPNFAQPSATLGTLNQTTNVFTPATSYGRSTQMLNRSIGGLNAVHQIGGPRSIQFTARIEF